jgi:glycogen operon protein
MDAAVPSCAAGQRNPSQRNPSRRNRWQAVEGAPNPLGLSYCAEECAYNFALYSKHATNVRLLLFTADEPVEPERVIDLDPRINKSGRVWHCRVPAEDLGNAAYYAYRVDGPHQPADGQRFDPAKVLFDPYARALYFPPGYSREAARHPGSNTGRAPLGIIRTGADPQFDWSGDRRPRHAHDTVIYELHVQGFTRRANSGVPPEARGTFAGLMAKIPYLRELGITAVELMPIFQFDPQEGNYWGYMPLSFFAVHDSYGMRNAFGEEIDEFKSLVKALHQADIEVILDVVCNHTGEGDENGPAFSYRGIDNTTYYLLEENRGHYRNDSGTGNVLNTANRYVRGMILDSLRYWVAEFHVDGFRFDLASLFTRREDGSINLDDPPIIAAIQSDPLLADVRLIAEAWDMASYQLGRTFPGSTWLQWNGRFRDTVRSFVRGDAGLADGLRTRIYGSDDLFPDTTIDSCHAFQSVNFVTCHDGFCLYDLVSYDMKHNEANGHGNRDGMDDNRSWNCGWEGDTGLPQDVRALRIRQAKNLFCLLMLANGTPMFTAGDEFLNTQGGNNNPYNQDNETTWLDWSLLARNGDFFRFAKSMIAFRKAHPSLGRSRFWRSDVRWLGASGEADPGSSLLAFHLTGAGEDDDDLYVAINGQSQDAVFILQAEGCWRLVVDTDHDTAGGGAAAAIRFYTEREAMPMRSRSIKVLLRETGKARPPPAPSSP